MPVPLDDEAEQRMQQVFQFQQEFPDEKEITASRIYNINDSTRRSRKLREKQGKKGRGG
jgi:hypothetical protein